jgi:hypothetical protein
LAAGLNHRQPLLKSRRGTLELTEASLESNDDAGQVSHAVMMRMRAGFGRLAVRLIAGRVHR